MPPPSPYLFLLSFTPHPSPYQVVLFIQFPCLPNQPSWNISTMFEGSAPVKPRAQPSLRSWGDRLCLNPETSWVHMSITRHIFTYFFLLLPFLSPLFLLLLFPQFFYLAWSDRQSNARVKSSISLFKVSGWFKNRKKM